MSADDFCINKLVPGYFSRINEDGSYSNGSGCGNDTASERNMVRKYIVDSVCYWADEYHMDGISALVLVKQDGAAMTIVIVLIAAVVVVAAGVVIVVMKKKKVNK